MSKLHLTPIRSPRRTIAAAMVPQRTREDLLEALEMARGRTCWRRPTSPSADPARDLLRLADRGSAAEQREIAVAAADTDDDDKAQEMSLGELFEMIEQVDAGGVTILVLIV